MRGPALAATLLLASSAVRAQELPAPTSFPSKDSSPAPAADGGPFVLRIWDEVAGRVHRLFSEDGEEIDSCTGNCTLRARRSGTYVVHIGSPIVRSERIELTRPTAVDIRDGSPTGRWVGATLGGVGSFASFIGLVGLVAAALSEGLAHPDCPPSPSCKHTEPISPAPWAVVFAAGSAMTVGGWVTYGVSRTRFDAYAVRVAAAPSGVGISMAF
jgi:hypothetical protein